MSEECKDIERETARAGDRYYGTMTEWLTRRRDSIELREKASVFGRVYRRSLDLMIRCLERLHPTEKTEKKIDLAHELKAQVESEVEFLQRSMSNLATAPDET